MNARVHGGADATGPVPWDFSTCANAAGPCPAALAAVQAADATRYPDAACSRVRAALADLHAVEPWRILPAASASEFIQRVTAVTARLWPGRVRVPRLAYGDYAVAAAAWGRAVQLQPTDAEPSAAGNRADATPHTLTWYADPTSPLGDDGTAYDAGAGPGVLDAVYAPLRLTGRSPWTAAARDGLFVLHSPNKALGLTGVRGAYAVAPRGADRVGYDLRACCAALAAAAPSWPLSAHAEALLTAWALPEAQAWVAQSRRVLSAWMAALRRRLAARGFELRPSVAPHFVVRPARPIDPLRLRAHGVAVRDAASFGLPGWWRVSAQPPASQDALMVALDSVAQPPAGRVGSTR